MSWKRALMIAGGSAEELCGLLYGGELLSVDNVAADRCAEYAMDTAQQLALMNQRGWPDAVWHTHPGGRRAPSSIDLSTMPAGMRMVIATTGWIGTWLDGQQVQEATMGKLNNDVGEVFQGDDGQWHWHVQAANGKVVEEGHGYNNKRNAAEALYRARPDLKPEEPTPDTTSASDAIGGGGTVTPPPPPTPPGSGVGGNSAGVGPSGPVTGG